MSVTTERFIINEERNVSLVAMLQAVGGEWSFQARPAVLILPGGGYMMCSDREAEVVAYPYLAAGFHAFVLRYSVKEHKTWPNPLDDYECAMEYIRSNAEQWHLLTDKIAVIGFSAGGHLAACAATMGKNRPNAAILGYAALEQEIASACQPNADVPAPVEHVDAKTPPCFLVAARDDSVVPVHNTVNFLLALDRYAITYECHIYPYGNHGFSTGAGQLNIDSVCPRVAKWVEDSIGFLWDIFGRLTSGGMAEPDCPTHMFADTEPTLSVQCSVRHLRSFASEVPALAQVIAAIDAYSSSIFTKGGASIADQFKLEMLLNMHQKTPEEIAALDSLLRSIQNTV